MSRDLMRGMGYGLGIAGMTQALWQHDRLFVALWGLYGILQLVSYQTPRQTTEGHDDG